MFRELTIHDSANVIERLRMFVIENMDIMALDNAKRMADEDNLNGFSVSDDGLSITINVRDDYKFLIQVIQKHSAEYTIFA